MNDEAKAQMPKYRSHKEVWALKIGEVRAPAIPVNQEHDGSMVIVPEDGSYGPIRVEYEYVRKHQPKAGGYYVVYQDGYQSFSPAEAFESGYTRL